MPFSDYSYAHFPLWLELSGLPTLLNDKAKGPFAWIVFRKIVELDVAENRVRPGLVEIPLLELAERCGLEPKRIDKAVKAMRKAGVMRAFLPDHEEETALFQVLTPLEPPKSADEVRAQFPSLFLDSEWPPRYAVAVPEDDADYEQDREAKIKRVVELYLNTFSMRMNSLILDQLQLISDRYDMPLIEKVFERAKKRDVHSLGWILTEIRREMKVQAKAEEIRKGDGQ